MIVSTEATPQTSLLIDEDASAGGRPVMLVTAEHLAAGRIETRDLRLFEILNDIDTSYVRITDVGLYGRTQNKQIATLRECVMSKSKLELALIFDDEHEAPQKRRYRFVEKETCPVFLSVHGCSVRGSLPLERVGATEPDPVWVLTQRTPHFFPVVEASVSRIGGQDNSLDCPVVIVNTDAVALFSIGRETEPADATRGQAPQR